MPANICVPIIKGGNPDVTARTTAAVVGKTFAAISGDIQSGPVITTAVVPLPYDGGNFQMATCGAGLKPDGVFAYDQAISLTVPVIRPKSVVPMTAGAAITAGQQVEVGAAGKPVPLAAGIAVGKAWTTALIATDVYIDVY